MTDGSANERVTARTTCRICGSASLADVMDLGDQCIAGAFRKPDGPPIPEPKLPLQLVRCDPGRDPAACGLLQLRHSVPGDLLYSSYWYRSGINRTMTDNLHGIAREAVDIVGGVLPGELVVDIGCNDGTLFDGYAGLADGARFVGVDPSDVTRYAVAKGYDVVNDYFSREALERHSPGQRAKVITSIAMFYDLEHPRSFVDDIADSLADDGIWVSEFSYMPTMLRMNSFDTICHEHLEYYSLAVIERLCAESGLEVVRAELNDVNGGSIRLFAGHAGGRGARPEDAAALDALRSSEAELELDTAAPYDAFGRRVAAVKDDLLRLLEGFRADGMRVHIYGASTKGNTLLQYVGLDATLIECAADRNEDKWGSETIGTHIPIVSEAESRARRPDYYLALPWHFLTEFLEREGDFLARGGKFVVPLPDVHLAPAASPGG
ncbi:MAG: class I SAM-dependent methyltransferase [Actinobacteria bacterium]|nr:MAG: class I SAM-dependent methyltransferase [Actinomycetota bacterium]